MNDGGPAFPTDSSMSPFVTSSPGMSLRDWFAGQALIGITMSASKLDAIVNYRSTGTAQEYTTIAYKLADAMLAARSKGETL